MSTPSKTGFNRFFDQQMKNPRFAASYRQARAQIDAADQLIRALDQARALGGLSKAELARKVSAKPEILRRLFTSKDANPTLDTVLKLAGALGYHLALVPNSPRRAGRLEARRSVAARHARQP